jgi:hypothetical protein
LQNLIASLRSPSLRACTVRHCELAKQSPVSRKTLVNYTITI